MNNSIQNASKALREVFSSLTYIGIAITFSIIIYSFNALITNYALLKSIFSFKLVFLLLIGSFSSMDVTGILMMILTSVLAGISLSMSAFIILRQIAFNVGASSSGIFMSVIAPSCPSCAMGLLSTLGIGSFLSILPFKGAELGVLAVILLLGTIIYLSKKVVTVTCKM